MEKTVEYKDSNEVHVYIILLFLQELIIHQQSILLQNNTTCLVPEFTIRSENCGLPLSLSKSLFLKTRGGLRAVWRRVNLHTEDRKFWCEVWGHQEKNENTVKKIKTLIYHIFWIYSYQLLHFKNYRFHTYCLSPSFCCLPLLFYGFFSAFLMNFLLPEHLSLFFDLYRL